MKNFIITGPTSSGKSQLALDLAHHVGAVIVNADSQQVYRGLEVLTAQPSPKAQAKVPHHLYGYVDVSESYSVGRWRDDVSRVVSEVKSPLVFVGGTGLYLKVLREGISPIPDIPESIRNEVRALPQTLSPEELHKRLQECDPAMAARLAPNDTQRILRALEVMEATGKSLNYWQTLPADKLDVGELTTLAILPDQGEARRKLYQRIDEDTEARLNNGGIKEVERLLRNYPADQFEHSAIGVRSVVHYVWGQVRKEEFVELVQTQSRQYAKRQMTWIRNQIVPDVGLKTIYTADQFAKVIEAVELL